jgi:hypothetical protein
MGVRRGYVVRIAAAALFALTAVLAALFALAVLASALDDDTCPCDDAFIPHTGWLLTGGAHNDLTF